MADDYTASNAGRIIIGLPVFGNIELFDDIDPFAVELVAGRTYRFDMQGVATGRGTLQDPLFSLFSDTGTVMLAEDDDSGLGLDASFNYTATRTGAHILLAASYSGAGTYQITISDTSIFQPADDYTSFIDTSGVLFVGGNVSGNIESPGDGDWFRVNLVSGATYRFDLQGAATGQGTLSDPYLGLVDSTGRIIHAVDDDDGDGLNAAFTFTPILSGNYYLAATGLGGVGSYRLSGVDTGVRMPMAAHPASPSLSPRSLTGDNIIDAATHGYYWFLDSSRTINWALADGFNGEAWSNSQTIIATLNGIFSNISSYANINFRHVGYFANQPEAYYAGSDITISLDNELISSNIGNSVWALGFFPNLLQTNNLFLGASNYFGYQGAPGDVLLNVNSAANSLPSYEPGSAGYALIIHELGHTLGLKHPFDSGGTNRPTLRQLGINDLDTDWFSVMAYNDDYNYNLRFWDPATPMAMDVLALQYLYGPNQLTNAGNSTHRLLQNEQYQTIWDAGGIDTVDVSGAAAGWEINLPYVQASSLNTTRLGLAVPMNETSLNSPHTLYWLMGDIENAVGSPFADVIGGSVFANRLSGLGGNDTLAGGDGFDIAEYRGARSSYTITGNAAGRMVTDGVAGRDGMDTLTGIERLTFSNGTLAFDTLRTDNAGRGYLIYRAAFDRVPDPEGLGYWIRELDRGQNFGVVVAGSFIASPEFIGKYGTGLDNVSFVNLIYQNVLDRGPDADGNAYWLGQLNGGYARSSLLASFAISAENVASVSPLIADGIWFV